MTPEESTVESVAAALRGFQTEPYGDLAITADRAALIAVRAVQREEYDAVQRNLDIMTLRLYAAVADAAAVHGFGSPEHLRLRYALTGEGDGEPSAEAWTTARIRVAAGDDHHQEENNA